MSYRTVEVELEDGRVTPHGAEPLPARAHALLTLLPSNGAPPAASRTSGSGLRRFLSAPNFSLTPEQFRASMEADFFEQ